MTCPVVRRAGGLVLALLALPGCFGMGPMPEDKRRVLLRGLGEQIFVPRYREFEDLAFELDARAREFCADPSDVTLTAVRNGWWAARAPWKRNDLLAFGPYDAPSYLGAAIDFWPGRAESADGVLADTTLLDAALIDALGVAEKGFPVIEYLLYDPAADVVALSAPGSRRCEYLVLLTEDLGEQATAIRQAWDPGAGDYLGELVEAGKGRQAFESIEMSLGEVVNRLVFTVENIRGEKLGVPAGNRSGGIPTPDSAESRFSGRSLEDTRDNLRGVEEVCFGAEAPSAESLARYLEGLGRADLVRELRAAFTASYAALDHVPEPLTESVFSDPAAVQAAIDELTNLQRLIQVDVVNAMSVVSTFNDADGD